MAVIKTNRKTWKKITPKEKKFAEAFVKCGIETQAYKAAGYSTKGKQWMSSAKKIPKRPHVRQYIDELNEKAYPMEQKIADIAEAKEILSNIVRQLATEEVVLPSGQKVKKAPALKDVTKAAELLMRAEGAFLDRSQVDISGTVPVVIKDDL